MADYLSVKERIQGGNDYFTVLLKGAPADIAPILENLNRQEAGIIGDPGI